MHWLLGFTSVFISCYKSNPLSFCFRHKIKLNDTQMHHRGLYDFFFLSKYTVTCIYLCTAAATFKITITSTFTIFTSRTHFQCRSLPQASWRLMSSLVHQTLPVSHLANANDAKPRWMSEYGVWRDEMVLCSIPCLRSLAVHRSSKGTKQIRTIPPYPITWLWCISHPLQLREDQKPQRRSWIAVVAGRWVSFHWVCPL